MVNAPVRNRLLQSLDNASWEALRIHPEPFRFVADQFLEERSTEIGEVCFIESGVLSIIVTSSPVNVTEVGMIGSEGATGSSIVLGAQASAFDIRVAVLGSGYSIRTDIMLALIQRLPALRTILLRYTDVMHSQFAHAASAYAQVNKAVRIARWLLMAFDRTGEGELHVTHEMLAAI